MKRSLIIIFTAIIFLSFTKSTDCRNFNFGTSSEIVMKSETSIFMKKELLAHNLVSITFIELAPTANYLHIYTFHNNKLNGLKTKKFSLTGDNSMMNVMSDYREAYIKYTKDCNAIIKEETEKKFGLKSFSLEVKNKKVFVKMVRESQDYFLVESILQK